MARGSGVFQRSHRGNAKDTASLQPIQFRAQNLGASIDCCSKWLFRSRALARQRECVCCVGTHVSNLYTAVDTPAEAAWSPCLARQRDLAHPPLEAHIPAHASSRTAVVSNRAFSFFSVN